MKRIKTVGTFVCGVVVGSMLFGGAAFAAAGILAERSTQIFFVDGQQVQMEAYAINGNNYVKVRDIGKAVDFAVDYDGSRNAVVIDSTKPYTDPAPTSKPTVQDGKNADGSINIPEGDAKLTLKEGDVVRCDDGTNYTITDMSRYDKNAFAAGPLPALPTATCDWSSFPAIELPEVEVRHFNNTAGEYIFIRNLYETRRMQYTLMNLAGNHPETSDNGKLHYNSKGTPSVRIQLSINADMSAQSFWPWKESELNKQFNSLPPGDYAVEAWDVYADGIFQYTEYKIYAF